MRVVHGLVTWFLLTMVVSAPASAALTIEITEGIEGALPIAIVPFGWEGDTAGPPADVAGVVAADLARSGRFAPLAEQDLVSKPQVAADVNFQAWRISGVENLVIGKVTDQGQQGLTVEFRLFDVFKGEQLYGQQFQTTKGKLRKLAHHISDIVYEQLTGQRGAFSTRIAYVSVLGQREGRRYSLNIADADGFNEQTILDSPTPLMSPSWAPDGRRLAYVSFEGGRSRIYIQDLATGSREPVTDFPGINGAPAWSPDGRWLALTLSKGGNPEIYVMDVASRRLQQITRSAAIDTEPAWSPDGRSLVFTSSRGGKPQVYRIAVANGKPAGPAQRLTFEGDYNARATYSPDGRHLAMVHRSRGVYRIGVLDVESGHLQVLTDSYLDESPSFAPNGSMIIYATNVNRRGVLAAVSIDGRVHQRLALQQGDVREPAWSPYVD